MPWPQSILYNIVASGVSGSLLEKVVPHIKKRCLAITKLLPGFLAMSSLVTALMTAPTAIGRDQTEKPGTAAKLESKTENQNQNQEQNNKNSKVLVVLVYDNHCKAWCGKVVPLLRELNCELQDKMILVELDNSPERANDAIKVAQEIGIIGDYKDIEAVPVVMIFNKSRKLVKQIDGPKDKCVYKAAIEKVVQ